MRSFSREERVQRAFQRVAHVMRGMWEETGTSDTRLFDEPMIRRDYVTVGISAQAERSGKHLHHEHVVPRLTVCLRCYEMFAGGATDAEVATEMSRLVRIVQITPTEKARLDNAPPRGLGLKQSMPEGWRIEHGNVYARLEAAGIIWKPITAFDAAL